MMSGIERPGPLDLLLDIHLITLKKSGQWWMFGGVFLITYGIILGGIIGDGFNRYYSMEMILIYAFPFIGVGIAVAIVGVQKHRAWKMLQKIRSEGSSSGPIMLPTYNQGYGQDGVLYPPRP